MNSLYLLTTGLVLISVTMTFGAMIVVFVIRSNAQIFWGHIDLPPILWVTTAVLIASSVTFEAARHHLLRGDQQRAFRFFAWTAALGLLFLIGQVTAWLQVIHSGVVLIHNPHSWFIFLFTALHGLHIVLGLSALVYLTLRTREPVSGPKYQMKTRALSRGASLFWHYLDFLWIVLFALLLLWHR